ncbi:hypothetical protein ACFE04_023891 [Oxalis oulophora]
MAPIRTSSETLTQQQQQQQQLIAKPPKHRLACFSFAAYAKNLTENLKTYNVPVSPGLTDHEFSTIESTFRFNFPPDLRSILQAGLPTGNHWPNWRSSSTTQLRLLLNLPGLCLSKNVTQNNFWSVSWGARNRPDNDKDCLSLVKGLLKNAPILVPIYRNCYIPTTPNLTGNPVFYIDEKHVFVLSFDVSGFFQDIEQFLQLGVFFKPLFKRLEKIGLSGVDNCMNMPAWAANEAREIDFWTDVAENGRRLVSRGSTRGWWSGIGMLRLEGCLEDVFWQLRDGGWTEEEVREMMMDGCDDPNGATQHSVTNVKGLSLKLLRAGWSTEEVVYSLHLENDDDCDFIEGMSFVGSNRSCSKGDDDHQ